MNEEQIIDFLIMQSAILGLEKENCPYYQIMKFIQKDIEEIKVLSKLYYEASENCIKYEKTIKKVLEYLDYIDDDILKTCNNYDVNGIEIVKILKEGLK